MINCDKCQKLVYESSIIFSVEHGFLCNRCDDVRG